MTSYRATSWQGNITRLITVLTITVGRHATKQAAHFHYPIIISNFAAQIEELMAKTLKEKTASGMWWSALNNGTMQLLNLVIGIFLARLLTRADYGMVGVLTIFTLLAGNLQSSGFTQGLINLKRPTARDYNSVFWFNVTVSIILYVVLFFSAPLIAAFFHEPALVPLSRFVFLAFLISSFGIAHGAFMTKNMMFREMAIVSCTALVVSGVVGIVHAWIYRSYWSLAWQQVVYIAVMNMGRYFYVKWKPSFKVDWGPVKSMFGFSSLILLTTMLNTLSQQVLTFIFGRIFPMKEVGDYSQANKWNTMGHTLVSGTVGMVAQTVMVAAGDELERERRVFRKMMRFTAFMAFPVMFGLALVSREFLLVTIGEQWLESSRLLGYLCIAGAFLPLYTVFQNLTISRGRSDMYLVCSVLQVILQISIVALYKWGMLVMVQAYVALIILWLLAWYTTARRLIGYSLFQFAKDILPFALISAAVMGITWLATRFIENLLLLLIARVIIAAVLYYVVMRLLRVKMLDECLEFLKAKVRIGGDKRDRQSNSSRMDSEANEAGAQ